MKKIVLALVCAAAVATVASAQTTTPKSSAPAKAPATTSQAKTTPAAPAKTHATRSHTMTAEVVSTDAAAKSITVKDAAGANQTYTAAGAAIKELAKVKAGESVRLTVHDTTVSNISPVKMHAKAVKK